MSLAINYWLRRRDRGKAESAADAHSNMDTYFPHASLGSLSQINLICASWLKAAERSQSTHIGREDRRSFDTGLAYAVPRRFGRSVGAWDPA